MAKPHAWVTSTYFAEGYPYSIVHTIGDVMFKEFGASLQVIGLTSLFHLPWNLKFLWGPFLDTYATKRRWLIWTEVAAAILILALAASTALPVVLPVASVIFVLLAVVSATHDIGIDGFYLEGLDTKDQSKYVGYRAMAYKIAMLLVAGPLIMLIAKVGWSIGLLAAGAVMAALLAYHAAFLPRVEKPGRPVQELLRSMLSLRVFLAASVVAAAVMAGRELFRSHAVERFGAAIAETAPVLAKISLAEWIGIALLLALITIMFSLGRIKRWAGRSESAYASAFVDFLAQPKVGYILGFIIFFRAGESFLLKMRYPFLRDIGMTMEQFGWASGTVGLIASFLGTMLGGWLISKHGLRRWIWPFIIGQNLLNLAYMALAFYHDSLSATGMAVSLQVMTAVVTIEAFGAGLGTAVFMIYIMRSCRPAFKAAHMAILTALMSVSFTFAGVASGFLAGWLGYGVYFGLTFLVTVPGMVLVFFIPHLEPPS